MTPQQSTTFVTVCKYPDTGDCSRRSSLPAGGGSSPVTAIGGARAGGRAWSG